MTLRHILFFILINILILKFVKKAIMNKNKNSFNKFIDFFLVKINPASDFERIKYRYLVHFLIIGLLLLIAFMIKTIAAGTYSSLYIQITFLISLTAFLFFFRIGKYKHIGNIVAVFIIYTEIFSVFFNFSKDIPENFLMDEFYLILAFMVLTPMFATRKIIFFNTISVLITAITAFYLKKDSFTPEILHTATIGLGVYVLSVIIIFVFSFLYTNILKKAFFQLDTQLKSIEEKNTAINQNNKMILLQNEEIKLAKKKAEESNKLKSSFLSNMSHEIRTPMNAVLGFTEILKTTELNDKQKEYLKIIENSGKHLLNLINDIIDISKLESNQIQVKETKCKLNYLLNELKDFFTLDLIKEHKNKVKIIVNKGFKDGNDMIMTDNLRLRQILINLIGNAVKFTESGTVEISYTLNQESMILFSVKDTGIGIPKNELGLIFERFRQSDKETEKKYGGTGLGLAICKACTNLLNGEIWAESEEGVGSVFKFTIPFKPVV